jgi:hypothetical protein
METLSAEHRAVLDLYKKQRPDIFARLPLPKKLAEEYGVPIKEDTVHLMDFMRNHLIIANGHYDEFEEKVACKVMDASGVEIEGKPKPTDPIEKLWDNAYNLQVRAHQIDNNKRARAEYGRIKKDEEINNYLESLKTEPTLNIIEGGTNAAFVPK